MNVIKIDLLMTNINNSVVIGVVMNRIYEGLVMMPCYVILALICLKISGLLWFACILVGLLALSFVFKVSIEKLVNNGVTVGKSLLILGVISWVCLIVCLSILGFAID
jgi:hypothetical protein